MSGISYRVGQSGARLISDLTESGQFCPDKVADIMEDLPFPLKTVAILSVTISGPCKTLLQSQGGFGELTHVFFQSTHKSLVTPVT